jgi:hypothetical protein
MQEHITFTDNPMNKRSELLPNILTPDDFHIEKMNQTKECNSGNYGARHEHRNWKFLKRNDGGVSQDESGNSGTRTLRCNSARIGSFTGEPIDEQVQEFHRMNGLSVNDFEWLKKTIELTKSFSEYLEYMKSNPLVVDSHPYNNTIPISYEAEHIPIEEVDSYEIKVKQMAPFLVYKETYKSNYRRILAIMKTLYKTTMNIPVADTVIQTIEHVFKMESHVYLKNPEFVFDDYIYHVYSYNNIVNNYELALNILKVFEYFFYKTTNYYTEIEYDLSCDNSLPHNNELH